MTEYARMRERAARRRRISIIVSGGTLLAMIIAASVAATVGLSKAKPQPATKTANGVVSIDNRSLWAAETPGSDTGCHGVGNYTDLSRGGSVTISDDTGAVLTTTSLQAGTVDNNGFCELPFTAASVPTARGPYGVQITRRKMVQVNENDLFSQITLTFGTPG